jgi:hypothetical protein
VYGELECTEGCCEIQNGCGRAELNQLIFSAKKAGMLESAISSRIELAIEDMGRQIAGDCMNYSVLVAKYRDSCKALIENPGSSLRLHHGARGGSSPLFAG